MKNNFLSVSGLDLIARLALIALVGIGALAALPSNAEARPAADPGIVVAPAPEGEPLSARFTVNVNGMNAPAYVAKVLCIEQVHPEVQTPGEAAFTSFDMGRKKATVTVTCADAVQAVKILPSSYKIIPKISGKTMTFDVGRPGQITVEVNGDWNNSLHVFANPLEMDVPKVGAPNVIYFGPGIHKVETVTVKSGQTLYVAAGAVLYGIPSSVNHGGPVIKVDGSNITVRGRGVIDSSLIPKPSPWGNLLHVHGDHIRVEGVILRDSPSWTFPVQQSGNVAIANIKLFGWRGNSDGIDVNSSHDVTISDCFFRVFDDDVVIKSSPLTGPSCKDVHVSRCILWNEIAHALSLGAELNRDVENVTFTDSDVIHDKGREWVLRVFHSGAGHVKNIVFDNIRVEESRRPMSLWIGKSIWVKGDERGHIDDVVFRNITFPTPARPDSIAVLTGFNANHAIHGVVFDHVTLAGKPLTSADIKANPFVDGVTVKP